MKLTHPPIHKGEKFLGNQRGSQLAPHLSHIKGIRMAQPAYDLDGEKIPGYFAMMADPSAAEEYNRVMESRLSAIRRGA